MTPNIASRAESLHIMLPSGSALHCYCHRLQHRLWKCTYRDDSHSQESWYHVNPWPPLTDLPPLRLNLGRDEPEILKECRDGRTRETSRMERCAVLTLSSRPQDTLGIAIIVHTWKRLTIQQHRVLVTAHGFGGGLLGRRHTKAQSSCPIQPLE